MRNRMMPLTLAAVLLAGIGAARAQVAAEPLPPDQVKTFAPLAVALIQQQFPEPPVKVDPHPDLVQGYHVQQQLGVVMIPDKNFSAEALEKAGEKEVPVGILATKSLTVEDKDAAIAADRVAVANFNDILKIPVFYLTTRAQGEVRTLEIYSKAGKALVSIPLKQHEATGDGVLSFKLANIDLEKKKLDVNLSLTKTYDTTVKMAYLEL